MSKASEVVAIALSQIGYKEKASNKNLDDNTANAGSANWTKYARDLASAGYYNGNKNGFAWCDVFVDWCFFKAYGKDEGQRIQCQTGPYGAGCTYSMQYYQQQGRCDKNPKVGDQIFFRYSGSNGADHTGIVVEVSSRQIVTVEGNSGNQVKRNTYARNYSCIIGYGHPLYDEDDGTTAAPAPSPVAETKKTEATEKAVTVSLNQLSQGSTGAQVKTIQRIIYVRGINSKIDIDGDFGPITKAGVINLQKKLFPNTASEWDGVVGKNTWTAALTALN
ncbi:MAG: CHAP domain-containing protein [Oscillospiraceae bacterium]|nr:CHAP domain-containing protein [Oscillospiraceae bacterium]